MIFCELFSELLSTLSDIEKLYAELNDQELLRNNEEENDYNTNSEDNEIFDNKEKPPGL